MEGKNGMLRESHYLSGRLTTLVEAHADRLTRDTVNKLQSSQQTPSYRKLPYGELHFRVNEVYQNLGRWLWEKTDAVIQSWYNELGERRCTEGIPLSEVLWALTVTKQQLIDDLDACTIADSAIELYRRQELDRLIGHFFDRAAYYTAVGYERSRVLTETASQSRKNHGAWVAYRNRDFPGSFRSVSHSSFSPYKGR